MTSRNLCVVIAIPPPAGTALNDVRARYEQIEGKLPAHITVLPPFPVDEARVSEVIEHLSGVASSAAPFDVRLTGTDTFRPGSPVVFVAVVDGLTDLDHLEQAVRAGAYAPARHRPYRPHVTIAHRVADDILDAASAAFSTFDAAVRIDNVSLFERRERRWELVRDFRLFG